MLDLRYANACVPGRKEVYAASGPSEDMQAYGRGLRRRPAPMLDGDPERLALAFSPTFALPGTPVLWYGDEIGRGETRVPSPDEAGEGPLVPEAEWRGARTVTAHNLSTKAVRWTVRGVEPPVHDHLAGAGIDLPRLPEGMEIVLPPRGWARARSEP